MTDPLIRDVSDTAYWIAHHRAAETARPDALFRDPLAGRLAGEHGKRIAATMPAQRMIGWSVAMRTCIIDDYIRSAIAQGADTVVNLGAGLDTRPYRMDLPAQLRWVEADYPHVIEYKESVLAGERPRCRLERVKMDLADLPRRREWLSGLNAGAKRILVLTEGVVPYLSVDEAAALADDLRALDRVGWWLVDYFSPDAAKYRQRSGMARKMQRAPFRFVPDDPFAFYAAHRWRLAEIRYLTEEGDRLGRPAPLPLLMRFVLAVVGPFVPRKRLQAHARFAGFMRFEPDA